MPLPVGLPFGYHGFTVRARGREGRATLLVAPKGGARGRFAGTWRAYGIFAPLFTLHSRRSWGSGDLADLDELSRFAAHEQASVIATLPLLAGFAPEPFEASPYRPVSRRFWHERWIDVERVPEFAWSATARRLVSGPNAEEVRAGFVHGRIVDGAAVTAAKRSVLSAMAEAVGASPQGRERALDRFVLERPDLVDYARFRATGDRFGIDFNRWPGPLAEGCCAGATSTLSTSGTTYTPSGSSASSWRNCPIASPSAARFSPSTCRSGSIPTATTSGGAASSTPPT